MLHTTHFNKYQFGSSQRLSNEQISQLAAYLEIPPKKTTTILGGRSQPIHTNLFGSGQVTIKKYYRGGIVRHIIRETHIKWGPTRPEAELLLLNRIEKLGINAPKAVAAITKGRLFYQAWLVMRKIKNARSLADLATIDRERVQKALPQLIDQINILVKNRIHHTDLHPGNVLIDGNGKVYLVDFDKCLTGCRNREKLIERYETRWRRAIEKYQLPKWLDIAIDKQI